MTPLDNPSGCDKVQSHRRRIYRAPRVTLLQRIARALSDGAKVMGEHLDRLQGAQS